MDTLQNLPRSLYTEMDTPELAVTKVFSSGAATGTDAEGTVAGTDVGMEEVGEWAVVEVAGLEEAVLPRTTSRIIL